MTTPPQWGDDKAMFSTSQKLLDQSQELVKQLAAQQWFQPILAQIGLPGISAAPKPMLPPGDLVLRDITWVTPNQPADFAALPPDVQGLFPGPFMGVSPTLNFGSLPQPSYGSLPAPPTVDLNYTYPNPVVNLPSAPSLLSLDVIDFNPASYVIPDFNGQVPVLSINRPNILNFVEPPRYTSGLLDDLTESLHEAIVNGTGTALSTPVQQAMWDAAREREYRQMGDAMDGLDRDQEELGYALPSGVWLDSRLKLRTEIANTNVGLSRDIMVKQSELQLENLGKAREIAAGLEGHWMEFANNVAQRTFEAAKYQIEAAIQLYNADVEIYKARLEGFKATIEVYTTYIEGVKARVAVLNAEIEFEKAKVSINTALVEQYKAQIQAAEAVLDIAKVQMEIVQTKAQIEKTKVDVFSAQVQAFVATVNAYTAEVEGYKANAEAQTAVENVYKTQVEAYSALVQAGTAQATARIEGYKAQVTGYEAKLDAFKAQLTAMVEQARAGAEYNQASAAAYTAEVQALATYNEVLVKEWEAVINAQIQLTTAAIKQAEANGQLAISSRQVSIEAIKGAASVMAQLGAAALGAIHWSNSSQWGDSSSASSSYSRSTSQVDEHIYSASV